MNAIISASAQLREQFREIWWQLDSGLPVFGRRYSHEEQLSREHFFRQKLGEFEAAAVKIRDNPDLSPQLYLELADQAGSAAADFYDLDSSSPDYLKAEGFYAATYAFFQGARSFDPELSLEDIIQALRNAWSMNMMQNLLGLPVEVTPSVLAYSLLYPYSDNLMDDPQLTLEDKKAFSDRFLLRLKGEPGQPASRTEQAIHDLVGLIESQYDRQRYPQVYESLLAIHAAQHTSLALMNPGASPYELDVLGITIEKGGCSSLADGYLVAGDLSPVLQEVSYFYGVLTQLVDDLQDVEQDVQAGLQTVFSQTAPHWPLDYLTNRTLQLGLEFLQGMEVFRRPQVEPLLEFITAAIFPLISEAVLTAPAYFSRDYLQEIQSRFPCRASFLQEMGERFNAGKMGAAEMVASAVFAAGAAENQAAEDGDSR
jgi:hypothetical protein